MEKQKILILGGTRFIGPSLITKLSGRMGDEVSLTCFHRGLHTRPMPALNTGITHRIGDRHDESRIEELFKDTWDIVIDLSAVDEQMIRLSLCHARNRCRRYVFISSSSVYTACGKTPHCEDEPLQSGTGEPYAVSKIRGERLLQEWFPHFTIIRPSKVYGPGNYYFSERSFLKMIQERGVISLKNDPILHFTYIDDLTEGICALLEEDGIYNVAGAEPARLSRFIQLIAGLHSLPVKFISDGESDVPFTGLSDRILDLSAVKRAVGWEPAVSLEEGLKRTFYPEKR